ncbi:MAG: crossover junction endodeoxyribonuclease RuvC [Caldisericia bacterium]|nr:crossover junction endodeoxyribonuclease RuvC [Caldisericia bacterium]
MLVFGIDPGIANTGYALVEKDKHDSFKVLETNNFVTKKIQTEKRLNQIFEFLKEKANSYSPDCFAIEKLYFNKNTKTALTIEEVRGIILLLAAQLNIQIFQYTPLEVKKTLTMYGKASKLETKIILESILKIELPKSDDACMLLELLCAIF